MNDEAKTYEIPQQNLERLLRDIEKLNKRADKLNVARITVETVKVEEREFTRVNEISGEVTKFVRKYHHLRIDGQTPKFAGWTFAATVSITEAGNVLRKSPFIDREFPEWRDCQPQCDHCKAKRARKETFLVMHESGEIKQVGRQCIRDFLGHQDPNALASWAEVIFSLGELAGAAEDDDWLGGGGSYREDCIHTESFLQHCAEWTLREGFRTQKQCEGIPGATSTRMQAVRSMFPRSREDYKWLKEIGFGISDAATELAGKAQAMVLERLGAKDELSDFEHNLMTLAKTSGFESKQGGIVAYIVGWYKREVEQDAERKVRESAKAQAKHWGTAGERCRNVTLRYLGSSSFDSQFGTTWIHRFDLDGCRLVWKTGKEPEFDEGDDATMTFTIKAHSEFKGWPQTEITRCVCHEVRHNVQG